MFNKLPSKACMVSHGSFCPKCAGNSACNSSLLLDLCLLIVIMCSCSLTCKHDNPFSCLSVLLQSAIFIMLIGAVTAGATDLSYSLPGYIWVTICAVSTAMYLLLIRALKDSTGACFEAIKCSIWI